MVAGETAFFVASNNVPTSGEYFLSAILFDTAGGTFMPSPGVDYAVFSDEALVFDGAAVDAGTLSLVLAE